MAGFLADLASALLFYGWRGVLSHGCDITGSLVCGMRDDVSFGYCVLLSQLLYGLLSAAKIFSGR